MLGYPNSYLPQGVGDNSMRPRKEQRGSERNSAAPGGAATTDRITFSMGPTLHKEIHELTRSVEAYASLEQDLVRYASPVFAGIRPAAMFSCPITCKDPDQIRIAHPQVLLESEYEHALENCRAQVEPYGVRIEELARRQTSALLLVCRPNLVQTTLAHPPTTHNLAALGYKPSDARACIEELKARIQAFDRIERSRDFWDFPHEVGYFLGYPHVDVVAYTRNRGRGYCAHGTWQAYGCARRMAAIASIFASHEACTNAYWKLYLEGASLGSLAALYEVSRV